MDTRKANVVDMTRGSIIRHLLKFAWPVFIGCICQRMYNFVDAYVVGRYLGDVALSAVSVAGVATYLYSSLALGVTTGVSVVMAQYFGAGDELSVKHTFVSSIYVAVGAALVLTAAGLITLDPLLRVLQTPEELIPDTRAYLSVIYIGGIATMMYNWIASVLRALGNSTMPLVFLILASILNVVLDVALVSWIPLGVAGTAWATVIAQLLSGAACMIYAWKVTPLMRVERAEWRYRSHYGREVLRYGLPTALQMSIISVSDMMLQTAVNTYGTTMVLAYGICLRVEGIGCQLGDALSAASATFTGQNIGAGDIGRVRKGVRASILMNVAGYIIVSIAIFACAEPIMRMFTDNAEAIGYGIEYMRIMAVFFVFLGLVCMFQSLLRAAGDIPVTIAMGISEVVTRVVFIMIFPRLFGFHGLWWVSPLTWVCASSLGLWRYLSGRWIGKAVTSANHDSPDSIEA